MKNERDANEALHQQAQKQAQSWMQPSKMKKQEKQSWLMKLLTKR